MHISKRENDPYNTLQFGCLDCCLDYCCHHAYYQWCLTDQHSSAQELLLIVLSVLLYYDEMRPLSFRVAQRHFIGHCDCCCHCHCFCCCFSNSIHQKGMSFRSASRAATAVGRHHSARSRLNFCRLPREHHKSCCYPLLPSSPLQPQELHKQEFVLPPPHPQPPAKKGPHCG